MAVLDTDFLIRLNAGDAAAAALLSELRGEPLVVPPWVAVEYITGHPGEPSEVLETLREAFTLVETSPEWVLATARLRRELRRKGRSVRLPDLWIGTFAVLFDSFVVTRNAKDYAAAGIATRSW